MSDDNLIQLPDELTEDQWWLILWAFITDIPENEWNDFAHDLIYKNRFSSSHKVVEVIKAFSEKCTATIKKGQILYRARLYFQDPLQEFLTTVFKKPDEIDSQDNTEKNIPYYNMKLAALVTAVEKGESRGEEIIDAYNSWQRKRFKGFDSSGSGAPPADVASSGRLNPEKIKYLYLAEDPQTAVYEVRPTIGQHVSVAAFKAIEDIKIYDLASDINPQEEPIVDSDYPLFHEIQRRFSEPNAGDAYRYLPTQYLGELIKQIGFDGVRFMSSLKNGGINVVLFDEKKCKAYRSDLIKVGNIELKLEKPEIYQLEELMNNDS